MVMGVLRATIVLVTRRTLTTTVEDAMKNTLDTKLMEVRNHMLAGGSNFRFVTLRELELMPGYTSYGLLGEHGKYESCIMVREGRVEGRLMMQIAAVLRSTALNL